MMFRKWISLTISFQLYDTKVSEAPAKTENKKIEAKAKVKLPYR